MRLPVPAVGNRSKPRRLDEAKHVRWHRHAHVVASAQQLQSGGGAGLDIAATSIARHHKFHRCSGRASLAGGVFQEIGGAGQAFGGFGHLSGDLAGSGGVVRAEE